MKFSRGCFQNLKWLKGNFSMSPLLITLIHTLIHRLCLQVDPLMGLWISDGSPETIGYPVVIYMDPMDKCGATTCFWKSRLYKTILCYKCILLLIWPAILPNQVKFDWNEIIDPSSVFVIVVDCRHCHDYSPDKMIVIVDILIISESRTIISAGWDPYIGHALNLYECDDEYEDKDINKSWMQWI